MRVTAGGRLGKTGYRRSSDGLESLFLGTKLGGG